MVHGYRWAVARRQDLDVLTERMDRRFDELNRRFGELDRRFDDLPRIFATKDDLQSQTTRSIGWMVATNATLVAAVSLIVALR